MESIDVERGNAMDSNDDQPMEHGGIHAVSDALARNPCCICRAAGAIFAFLGTANAVTCLDIRHRACGKGEPSFWPTGRCLDPD